MIIANLTGARSPASLRFEPQIFKISSIKPINAPPARPASGSQVCSRFKFSKTEITITATTPIIPAIVGILRAIFLACNLFTTVKASPVTDAVFCFFQNLYL